MAGEQSHQAGLGENGHGNIPGALDGVPSSAGPAASPPAVSFIVAIHNVRPFVEKAIASALAQTGVSLEVVVVDDASDDGSRELVASMARRDARVRLVAHIERQGPSVARNTAIAAARGEWIAVLDGDDVILPDRSRSLIDVAEATAADIVADNYERMDVDGRSLASTMMPSAPRPYALVVGAADFIEANIAFSRGRMTLGAVKPMIRRRFLLDHAIAYRTDLDYGEDYDFLLACLAAGARFVVGSQTSYKYRMRHGSQSWRLGRHQVELLLRAHSEADVAGRFANQRCVVQTAGRYKAALENARAFLDVVETQKEAGVAAGLRRALAHPEAWRLLGRYGIEAVGRRAGLWP
jgi:succinoglycan biosynthesis protein ExoO